MTMSSINGPGDHVVYPDSDGAPMAENALQAEIIVMLRIGFQRLFADRDDAFVGGDLFWYPVAGDPKTVAAPDVLVAVGLPARLDIRTLRSYRPFEHGGGVMLAVEVLSPSNTWVEMTRKRQFYERFGVDEYWVFDPETGVLEVWARLDDRLRQLDVPAEGIVSPTTHVHVAVVEGDLLVHDPEGGQCWLWGLPLAEQAARAAQEAARADAAEARIRELEAQLEIR